VEAAAGRVEAAAGRVEAAAGRVEAAAGRVEATAGRVEAAAGRHIDRVRRLTLEDLRRAALPGIAVRDDASGVRPRADRVNHLNSRLGCLSGQTRQPPRPNRRRDVI